MVLFEQEGYVEEAEEEVLFNHFVVLQALGHEIEGLSFLRWAHERLTQKGQELEGQARQNFMERLPLNRAIAAEYARRQGLEPGQCRFSLAAAPPAATGERIDVVWTVEASPADAELLARDGKVTQRRARLQRLLAEAHEQGAVPTQADLACALGVSGRTIRNDLAALRQEGQPLESRVPKS